MTDEQYADVVQRDIEIKKFNEDLETFKANHYDESTGKFDSEENEKLAREMDQNLITNISKAKVPLTKFF